ncbi:MAG: carboxypeptidase-like regulatory domain-containing protein [Myxococcota bacterium]
MKTPHASRIPGLILLTLAAGNAAATTEIGECIEYSVVRFTADSDFYVVDCSARYDGWDYYTACGYRDCAEEGCAGFDCVWDWGSECGGALSHLSCDVSQGLGCIDGYCEPSSACDPATFTRSCNGNHLETCSRTVNSTDCTEGGTKPYTCGLNSAGIADCLGLEGGVCDPSERWECAPGLECIGHVCKPPSPTVLDCTTLDRFGACNGDVVNRCHVGTEVPLDCAAEFGPTATCGLVDCTDPDGSCVGYLCVARLGEACGALPCDVSLGLGCVDGVCQPSEVCDPTTYAPECDDTRVTYCTHTVARFDCAGDGLLPFTCGPNSQGKNACLGLAGAECDLAMGAECAPEHTCVDGICVPPVTELDAGLPDANVGADAAVDVDANAPINDAGAPDAGGPTNMDAGVLDAARPDAAMAPPDAAVTILDATVNPPDAAVDAPDAALNTPDAARSDANVAPTPDATVVDAAGTADSSVTPDATVHPDAAHPDSAGTGGDAAKTTPPEQEPEGGGCNCSTGNERTAAPWLMLAALVFAVRRRGQRGWMLGLLLALLTTEARAQTRSETFQVKKMSIGYQVNANRNPTTPNRLAARLPELQPARAELKKAMYANVGKSETTVYTNIPDNFRVGTSGAGPCVGVLIVGNNGTAVVGHYDPDGDDPQTSLAAIMPNVCITEPRAYLFTVTPDDPHSGRSMRAALNFLRCANIPVLGFARTDSLYTDNKGRITANTTPQNGNTRTELSVGDVITFAGSTFAGSMLDPTGAAGLAALNACPSLPQPPVPACNITGTAVAKCPETPQEPLVQESVDVVGDCGFRQSVVTDGQGRVFMSSKAVPQDCTSLWMEHVAGGERFGSAPAPLGPTVDLGTLQSEAALTRPFGLVEKYDGTPGAGATVTWDRSPSGEARRVRVADGAGAFQFPPRWNSCEVQVDAALGDEKGWSTPTDAVHYGPTDVGTIRMCPPGTLECTYQLKGTVQRCNGDYPLASIPVDFVGDCGFRQTVLSDAAGEVYLDASLVAPACNTVWMEYVEGNVTFESAHVPVGGAWIQELGALVVDRALTAVSGVVVDQAGAPVEGASVTWETRQTTSQPDGTFSFAEDHGRCLVRVRAQSNGVTGYSRPKQAEDDGTTDVGNVLLAPERLYFLRVPESGQGPYVLHNVATDGSDLATWGALPRLSHIATVDISPDGHYAGYTCCAGSCDANDPDIYRMCILDLHVGGNPIFVGRSGGGEDIFARWSVDNYLYFNRNQEAVSTIIKVDPSGNVVASFPVAGRMAPNPSPDGRLLAISGAVYDSSDRIVELRDAETGAVLSMDYIDYGGLTEWFPDGTGLLLNDGFYGFRVYDVVGDSLFLNNSFDLGRPYNDQTGLPPAISQDGSVVAWSYFVLGSWMEIAIGPLGQTPGGLASTPSAEMVAGFASDQP